MATTTFAAMRGAIRTKTDDDGSSFRTRHQSCDEYRVIGNGSLVSLGGAAIVTSSARGRQGATAGMHVAGERSSAAMRAACVMPKSRRGATSAAVETESASIVAARSIPLGGELSPWSHGIVRS